MSLCPVFMSCRYVTSLCHVIMSCCYVMLLCHVVMSYGVLCKFLAQSDVNSLRYSKLKKFGMDTQTHRIVYRVAPQLKIQVCKICIALIKLPTEIINSVH